MLPRDKMQYPQKSGFRYDNEVDGKYKNRPDTCPAYTLFDGGRCMLCTGPVTKNMYVLITNVKAGRFGVVCNNHNSIVLHNNGTATVVGTVGLMNRLEHEKK